MRTTMKATMIGLAVVALGLLLTPDAKSGSSCCTSTSAVSSTEVQGMPEVNQDIVRLEELSGRLARNISELEDRLSGMIGGIEEDRLRMELEGAERVVATLRSDIVDYQVLTLKVIASVGHATSGGNENPVPTVATQEGCSH